MAKTRRKSGGTNNGWFKKKKMGKGWAAQRKVRGRPKPVVRTTTDDAGAGQPSDESAAASVAS